MINANKLILSELAIEIKIFKNFLVKTLAGIKN